MAANFDNPFLFMVGFNLDPADDELEPFFQYYRHTRIPDMLTANGFLHGELYELTVQDPRGEIGPRWLATYEVSDEATVKAYLDRTTGQNATSPRHPADTGAAPGAAVLSRAQNVWRLVWQQISATSGPSETPTTAIRIVGMDPPEWATEDDVAAFSEYYTNVRIRPQVARNRFLRGTRYERYHDLADETPECPRFLAAYEVGEPKADLDELPAESPYTDVPRVWEEHETPWRLSYRRVTD